MSRGSTTIDPTKSWLNCYHKDKISGKQGRLRLTREHKKAICDFIRDSRKVNDNRTEDDLAYLEKFAREVAHFDPQEGELASQMLSKIKTRMHNVRCELRKVDTLGNQEDGERPNGIPEDDARTKKLKGLLKTEWSRPEDWAVFIDVAIAIHGEDFAEYLRDRFQADDPMDATRMGDESMLEAGAANGWTAVNNSHPDGLKAPIDLKNRMSNGQHDVVVSPGQTTGVPHILEPDAPSSKPTPQHPSPAPSFKRRKLDSAEEESNGKPQMIEAAKTIYKLTMERSSQIRERAGKTTIDEKRSDTMFFWEKENANRRLEDEWTKIGVGQYGLEKDDDGRAYGNVVQSGDWGTRAHKMCIEGEKVRVLRRPGQEGRQIDIITSMEIEDEEAVKFDGA